MMSTDWMTTQALAKIWILLDHLKLKFLVTNLSLFIKYKKKTEKYNHFRLSGIKRFFGVAVNNAKSMFVQILY